MRFFGTPCHNANDPCQFYFSVIILHTNLNSISINHRMPMRQPQLLCFLQAVPHFTQSLSLAHQFPVPTVLQVATAQSYIPEGLVSPEQIKVHLYFVLLCITDPSDLRSLIVISTLILSRSSFSTFSIQNTASPQEGFKPFTSPPSLWVSTEKSFLFLVGLVTWISA